MMEHEIIIYDLINRLFLKFQDYEEISFKELKNYFCKVHRISNKISEYFIYNLLCEDFLIRDKINYKLNKDKMKTINNFIEDNYLKINKFILKNSIYQKK